MADQREKVIVIVGPTGVGKSALSVDLAKTLDGEVISGDSIQVYRGMDIGSAKVTAAEMQGVPHHLIDEYDYHEEYNVKVFQRRCRECIQEIIARKHMPILCGGTGLYIKAALYDYEFAQEQPDEDYQRFLETLSQEQLADALRIIDPRSYEKIHPNNRKRILRALSIAHHGEAKSAIEARQTHMPLYDVYMIGLTMNRDHLYARIDQRVDKMLQEGLLEEIKGLIHAPADWDLHSMQGIGYKEWKPYFQGNAALSQCAEQVKKNSRNFAKRQYTWFRNQFEVNWYDVEQPGWRQALDARLEEWRKDDGNSRNQNSPADRG